MALNRDLLFRTLEEIEKFPETHDQNGWFKPVERPVPSKDGELCNTSFCFAGHAAVLDGVAHPEPEERLGKAFRVRQRADWYVQPETRESIMCEDYEAVLAAQEAGAVSIETYARGLLGLTFDQKEELFYCYGGHVELREIVERFIRFEDRVGVRPGDLEDED